METTKWKRKVILLAPVVVVVLLATGFWMLGGGRGAAKAVDGAGINVTVPDAHVTESKGETKWSFYEKAKRDSIEQEGEGKKDSLARLDHLSVAPDNIEAAVNEKMKQVKIALGKTASPGATEGTVSPGGREAVAAAGSVRTGGLAAGLASSDIDRLEHLYRVMKTEGGDNAEMQELNKTLDKLMVLKHPVAGVPDTAFKRVSLPVGVAAGGQVVSSLGSDGSLGVVRNRFYDLENVKEEEPGPAAMIEASVPETQTLVDGGLLKLELKTALVIRGVAIPSGTALYGSTRLSNERLLVKISSIRYREQVFPVALEIMDMDGLAGIYEPGSIGRESVQESAGQGIGSLGVSSLDNSLGGQAANAGIQMARSLAGRKVRQVRVSVRAGYRVFLEDMSHR